ncbi:mucin-like protein [Oculina patagonica]
MKNESLPSIESASVSSSMSGQSDIGSASVLKTQVASESNFSSQTQSPNAFITATTSARLQVTIATDFFWQTESPTPSFTTTSPSSLQVTRESVFVSQTQKPTPSLTKTSSSSSQGAIESDLFPQTKTPTPSLSVSTQMSSSQQVSTSQKTSQTTKPSVSSTSPSASVSMSVSGTLSASQPKPTSQSATASLSQKVSVSSSESASVRPSESQSHSSTPSLTRSSSVITPSSSKNGSLSTSPSESSFPSPSPNISASKTTMTPVPSTTAIPYESNMYPYGPQYNDDEFRLEDSPYFSYYHCLKINTDWTGFPFFSERHYKLHICRNGIIQMNYEWSWWWPRKFGAYRWFRNMAVMAPFWATTDMNFAFRANHSKVYYQVYKQSTESSAAILSMATKHVQNYTGNFTNFNATWVLVVTWVKLCPYVYYPYYYYYRNNDDFQLNCPWSNTFQAVIITDGFNTFLMYNYPYGGIQWVVPADRKYYRYWTNYYGLPVAGWNAGDNGQNYHNHKSSGTFGMYYLDEKKGNTGLMGRYFWRIENSDGRGALEKCYTWAVLNQFANFRYWYYRLMKSDSQMACPCTARQAWLDRGRFSWNWRYSWPERCFESRRSKLIYHPSTGLVGLRLKQECCYSTQWQDWGSLKIGPPDGGHVKVTAFFYWFNRVITFYTDEQAYKYCCVDIPWCNLFYFYRPSDDCSLYIPPPRPWIWGDPHIKTLDGGNYTFNGLGEYVMIDAQNGAFQLQARTKLAQGNSTVATIFSAGAAKEENTSTIEARVKEGGGLVVRINQKIYNGYKNLTNRTVEVERNLYVSKPEENCLQVSFPSTMSVTFCEKNGMLSIVVNPAEVYKNATKGLMGTMNGNPDDDFTLPDESVLPLSSTLREIHFGFGVKWQINQSQSLFTYAANESVDTFADPDFEPMFADNITWHNNSLRDEARRQCGDDHECLFDVASTNDLSVGLATKDISVQLVNESNELNNFPPKIVTASNVINATLYETVELNITAVDNDTITFRVMNKPVGATWNQSGNLLSFIWNVTSSQKFNLTFVATDDKGASATWSPTINMCACNHGGQCVPPEEGDIVNTDSRFVYMGCACQGGYTGRFCDSDIDACEMNGQPCYTGVTCIDLPPPANASGYVCGPCPSGYTGNGAQCVDVDECQNKSMNNCEQLCINLPGSFFCDCHNGFKLNADGHSCDDINECLPSNDCMQKCTNTVGSYNCSCDKFFEPDPADWKKCVATNPCSADHGCGQVCFKVSNNQANCTCIANYELQNDGKTCKDIDECDPANPLHRCSQICINTPGSYNCSCQKGFELSQDGYECEDVNECLDEDLFSCTDEFHRCVNTRGSYKCECEQGLYFIDGKCKGLEKNETAPEPVLSEPRVPSKKEEEEAVQFLIPRTNEFEWDFAKDKSFKEEMASVTTDYCTENRTRCALKDARRKRRSPIFDLYTADQVHLLPGYPRNSSGSLLVAFYVQQPLGLFIGNFSVLPRDTLVDIVTTHKSVIETAIGANISNIEAWFKPTITPTTSPTAIADKPSSNDWKWIAIGIGVGVVVIILIIAIVSWCVKRKKTKPSIEPIPDYSSQEVITLKHYDRSSSMEPGDPRENPAFQM